MNKKVVYVVHNIDTEGPLYESLEATFERIENIVELEFEPSFELLEKLQKGEVDLGGKEDIVKNLVAPNRIGFLPSWDQIDTVLDEITSLEYRKKYGDSEGNPWIFNWLCLDHAGITGINPRRRDMGYHSIFDHYYYYGKRKKDTLDLIQWHYHALALTNDAHKAGTTYLDSNHIYEILSRKVIERSWFPTVFRPGINTERPDSHWFLEQWIPFDYGSHRLDRETNQIDLAAARFGDWRRAPKSWLPYHPSHDDYQTAGHCRRWISRCLAMESRVGDINQEDVDLAFEEAIEHGASILSFANHDYRDMRPEIHKVWTLIKNSSEKYPDVVFKHVNAIEAMRAVAGLGSLEAPEFDVRIERHKSYVKLHVKAKNPIFGPQPYLALKSRGNTYHWQNFDFEGPQYWSFTFDFYTFQWEQVEAIGVASNTASGVTEVVNITPKGDEEEITTSVYNQTFNTPLAKSN
jgi:hypothetical protein